jgi:hypothetical protein
VGSFALAQALSFFGVGIAVYYTSFIKRISAKVNEIAKCRIVKNKITISCALVILVSFFTLFCVVAHAGSISF